MKSFVYLQLALIELPIVVAFSFNMLSSSIAIAVQFPRTQQCPSIEDFPGQIADALPIPTVTSKTVKTFEDAIQMIDNCAKREETCDDLYDAVRLIERKAIVFYPEADDKDALWERAQGTFKLILSTGNAKNRAFHPPSYLFPFSYAMIQGEHFGNGFGLNPANIWVSVLQKHYWNPRIRQMVVTRKKGRIDQAKVRSFGTKKSFDKMASSSADRIMLVINN